MIFILSKKPNNEKGFLYVYYHHFLIHYLKMFTVMYHMERE